MPTGFDIFAAAFATNVLPVGVAANQNRDVARPNAAEDGKGTPDETEGLQQSKTGRRRSRPRSSPTPPSSVSGS